MITLSEREHLVAEQYCKGLADKEVADSLQRSEWTIKAQKRIYTKSWVFPKIPSLYYTCSVSA
ncbi:DNA-binding response regulator [Phocaeicola vulgatus]|nr:DNA-binding response regulator [Phocaeicola vulgatus]